MLKKDLYDRTWFFDLEWVPDADAARRLYDLPDDVSEQVAMEELWKRTGATADNPRPFVKYLFSRVVSIAFLSRNAVYKDGERALDFNLYSLPRLPLDGVASEEARIIEQFLYYIGERKPQLVGYNSAEADVQVLIQRGLVNEVSAPVFCTRPENRWKGEDYFNRWDNEWHLDLIKLFSNGRGMTPKLNDLARLCGFPGKIDVNGEQVVDLWLAGDVSKIVEYNQLDTLNTYLIWLRVVHFCGKMNESDYAFELDSFRTFLEAEAVKPHMQHLAKFLDKWEL